ncbi:MAG: MBL fold metallo-hydrolase [Oscillospiraceae bacterium]
MKVMTLLENTAVSDDLRHAHGLSLYVETPTRKLLFDMGPNAGFLENAEKLGVDIAAVDMAFLSHGHYDHSGGMELFCKRNDHAKIVLHQDAFGDFWAVSPKGNTYIGIDPHFKKFADRFVFTHGQAVIEDGLQVFSDIVTSDYPSSANGTLREKIGDSYPPEDFRHEQNLLVTAEGKTLLLAGCAHRGIVNILRRSEAILGRSPDVVCAGFHLYNPTTGAPEPRELIEAVGAELKARTGTVYYTGHCTGGEAFAILRESLGDRIQPLSGGRGFEI